MTIKKVKIIVEKNVDGYIAYPVGLYGVILGQGRTYQEVLEDVESAIQFHLESFGPETLDANPPVLEAFVAEVDIEI